MSYEGLLTEWRFAPVGSPIFQGVNGEYFQKAMKEKSVTVSEHSATSKRIGWGN